MNEVELSVIIPVYNTEKYIERCLNSVLNAVNKLKEKSEIIIINDGSPDNSENIIKKFIEKYPDLIKYYKKENAGLADTKNFGIKHAKGKYLSFVDSDDYIDEDFYFDTLSIIQNENIDLLICDWETIDETNSKNYIVEAKNPKYTDDKWGCIDNMIMPSSCNKIVRRELFNELNFPDGYIYEDLATTLILFCRANKIKYINKPYYKYYLSEASIMRTSFNEKNLQMIDIFDILFKRLSKEESISDEEKCKMIYMVFTRRFYESILEPISKLKFKERYKFVKMLSKKMKSIIKNVNTNIYLKLEFKKNNFIKKIFNKLLFFCLNNNFYLIITLLIDKKIYYKLLHIKYASK